ncbi:hypothetical protein BVRB_1g020720 [Beta vulgaris subsp. vulgaris]|uniref:Uncharacterized protein n=1 Tax=Beta vulgaris subsp. vulgaris TaxID=3555 RepID=A0A0J8BIG0_BETVV|nr:hypothetical protein BVRB_1g020720 [Beta vulgaris subsp. vulgaris]
MHATYFSTPLHFSVFTLSSLKLSHSLNSRKFLVVGDRSSASVVTLQRRSSLVGVFSQLFSVGRRTKWHWHDHWSWGLYFDRYCC